MLSFGRLISSSIFGTPKLLTRTTVTTLGPGRKLARGKSQVLLVSGTMFLLLLELCAFCQNDITREDDC